MSTSQAGDSSSVLGVFSRINHPKGWGFGYSIGRCEKGHSIAADNGATAHGYVTLFVRCADADELAAVCAQLARGWKGIDAPGKQYADGTLGDWFGGQFDLLATVPDGPVDFGSYYREQRCRVLGDNRFVGLFDADEVLR